MRSMGDGRRRGVKASRSESERVGVSQIGNVRMNQSGRQNSSAIGWRERGGGHSEGADCRVLASSSMWCTSGLSLNRNMLRMDSRRVLVCCGFGSTHRNIRVQFQLVLLSLVCVGHMCGMHVSLLVTQSIDQGAPPLSNASNSCQARLSLISIWAL